MPRRLEGSVRFQGGRWKARILVEGRERLVLIDPPLTDPGAHDQAKEAARRLLRLVARPKAAPETVAEWSHRWLHARTARGLVGNAIRSHLHVHVLPAIGTRPMRDVTRRDLEPIVEVLDGKLARGELRGKTPRHVWSTICTMFDDACRSKIVELRVRDDNPTRLVRGPNRGVRTEHVVLYPDEFLQLVSCPAIDRHRRRAYAIAIYCYLRPAELEALLWEDIDLVHQIVQIRRSIGRERRVAKAPKSGRARVPFTLEPALVPLLRVMRRPSGPVVGRLGNERDLARRLRADLLVAGVDRHELHVVSDDPPRAWMTMHDLRRTGVTWMAVRGDSVFTILARAGHASTDTTMYYVELAELVRPSHGEPFPPLPAELLETGP
ncbi:MAG: site-specific integrase [Myxococcales bacterium]|nr:site-specific integrase [Myxococcales bacterium]